MRGSMGSLYRTYKSSLMELFSLLANWKLSGAHSVTLKPRLWEALQLCTPAALVASAI